MQARVVTPVIVRRAADLQDVQDRRRMLAGVQQRIGVPEHADNLLRRVSSPLLRRDRMVYLSNGFETLIPDYSWICRVGRANQSEGGTSAAQPNSLTTHRAHGPHGGLRRPTSNLRGLVPPYANNPG